MGLLSMSLPVMAKTPRMNVDQRLKMRGFDDVVFDQFWVKRE